MKRNHPSSLTCLQTQFLSLFCLSACILTAQAQDDISSDIEAIRNNRNMPGMSALVVKSGYVLAEGAAGVRRQGQPNPLLVTDQINIASCTKWMTATIAGRLVDQGIIQWDTSVRDLFPNFQQFDAAFHDATLSDFLAHRSGVQASPQFDSSHWSTLYALSGSESERRRWVSEAVLTDEPAVAPGTYLYANQGYAVAATMMEIASGFTWEQLMTQEIFQPLRMNSAFLGQSFNNELPPEFPVGHDLQDGSTLATPRTALSPSVHIPLQAAYGPGGSVVCTLNDWAKFLHAQVTVDESNYLSAASSTALQSPFIGEEGYGLGVWAGNRGWASPGQALSHSGDIFGHRTVFWIAPAKDFIVVVFANCRSEDNRTFQALDEVAGLLVGRYNNATVSGRPLELKAGDIDRDGDVDADDIDFYSGNLGQPATGDLAELDLDGDGLVTLADHDLIITTLVETSNGRSGTLIGDVNLDGEVDVLNDAFALVAGLGASIGGYANGDLNADGAVNVLGDAFRLISNLGLSNELQ